MIKLLKFFKPESLARARRRIKSDLKRSHVALVYRNIFRDGTHGYERETYVYGEYK